MEDTIRVGTSVDCNTIDAHSDIVYPKAMCTHNALGCHFVELFKLIYKLNVTYIIFEPEMVETDNMVSLLKDGTIDIYARPVGLREEIMDDAYPIHALFMWRIGFILRRERTQRMLKTFYSKPFSALVWNCLHGITLLVPLLFLLISRWDRTLGNNGESSFVFELLLAVGGLCQHVFSVETISVSRRIAYFTFFLFCYVVYTFYTSNLLSHIVNDKESAMSLTQLEQSGYSYMFLEGIKEYQSRLGHINGSRILKEIQNVPVVSISAGIEAVRRNKTALLTDYAIVYREIKNTFSAKEICDLIEIDLFSSIHKYLITSKTFRYKEQMKISTLRIQEAGILERLTTTNTFAPLECNLVAEVTTSFEQISSLLLLLTCVYIATGLILICEKLHYNRYRLYPYLN